jgi:hypothetical protein
MRMEITDGRHPVAHRICSHGKHQYYLPHGISQRAPPFLVHVAQIGW